MQNQVICVIIIFGDNIGQASIKEPWYDGFRMSLKCCKSCTYVVLFADRQTWKLQDACSWYKID